jgi:hypothetical protein
VLTGGAKYGLSAMQPLTKDLHAASNGAVQAAQSSTAAENPLVWLVGIGALTLGLVAVSTSVRIGPLRASASAGK